MDSATVLHNVLDRVAESATGKSAIFMADEVARWPRGMVGALVEAGLLKPAQRAITATCRGCDERCRRDIQPVQGDKKFGTRYISTCHLRPDVTFFEHPINQLRRWRTNIPILSGAVTRSLGLKNAPVIAADGEVVLGRLQARFGRRTLRLEFREFEPLLLVGTQAIKLLEVMRLDGKKLFLDRDAIQYLADQKPAPHSASARYRTRIEKREARKRRTDERDQKIMDEALRLKRNTKWNWSRIAKEIAKMDFVGDISPERVRRIINDRK